MIVILEEDGLCYMDYGDRVLPDAKIMRDPSMTVEKCKDFCFSAGYQYAGVEFSKECWCGNQRPEDEQPEEECAMACTGDNNQICGDRWRLNVYYMGNMQVVTFRINSSYTVGAD